MSDSASWWKNSALLMLLLSVPLIIASFPAGGRDVSQRPADAAPLRDPDPQPASTPGASPSSSDSQPAAEQQAARPATDASEATVPAAAEPAEAAPMAVVASLTPAAPPEVNPSDLAGGEMDEWQRDVNERIRKAAMSEIFVSIADGHEKLDNNVLEIEAIEREVAELRHRLEYLDELKRKWSGQPE